ncbi:hypothetical protein [Legionella sp. km772]|uniref:hypothetical protein n=1 Tax=Legionella sp. km772 TaxID=2498111 RepID=UPI000F8EBB45|nr:hypothetical protein [Legionella sp. km772]RUR05549.1 hypothetical protein ELY15_14180 [Legionella sp. km772]
MKKLGLVLLLLSTPMSLVFAAQKMIVCTLQGLTDSISFAVPRKLGDVPKLDFTYPVDTSIFSMRNGNLVLIAMDHDDKSRVRLVISAQAKKNKSVYQGQFVIDSGGNELQIDNGAVSCQ